jgi:non-ribosomal peptide synthetase component F
MLIYTRLADKWAAQATFYNICGPTEITILNSAHRHTPGIPLTIGRPLPNTTCYILDDDEQPVPVGKEGIMWVGGAGVSRGYINLKALTMTRYKPDKFKNDGYVCKFPLIRHNANVKQIDNVQHWRHCALQRRW